jgi:SAM-dependent methyltransferase
LRPAEVDAARAWDGVLVGWRTGSGTAALRAYSDAVNSALVREWLPDAHGLRILKTDLFDEAVAPGIFPELRARGASVVGVDVSPAVVAAARERYPELDARTADVRALDLADASFDVVVSNSTLDHFDSLDEVADALAELRRVLAPGGLLLVTLDNGANPLVALRNAAPARLLRGVGLVPYPTGATCGPRRLRRLLSEAGFTVETTRAVMHFPRVLLRLAPRLLGAALRLEPVRATRTGSLTGQFVAARARRG